MNYILNIQMKIIIISILLNTYKYKYNSINVQSTIKVQRIINDETTIYLNNNL